MKVYISADAEDCVSFTEYEVYRRDINYINTVIQCVSNSSNLFVVYVLLKYKLVLVFCLSPPPFTSVAYCFNCEVYRIQLSMELESDFQNIGLNSRAWVYDTLSGPNSVNFVSVSTLADSCNDGQEYALTIYQTETLKWYLLSSCCYLNPAFYFPDLFADWCYYDGNTSSQVSHINMM